MLEFSIRPVKVEDAEAVNAIRRMDGVRENTLGLFSERYVRSEEFIKELTENDHMLVAETAEKVIGLVGLNLSRNPRLRHSASIGIMVHGDYQGKGVGTAMLKKVLDLADNWLMLVRVELTAFVENEGAVRLYKSLGFEIEGVKRYAGIKDGKYANEFLMARYNLKLIPNHPDGDGTKAPLIKSLETERLVLRPWRPEDLDDFYEYAKNPNVGPNAGWEPHRDKEASQKILQSFIKGDEVWALEYKENGKVIGSVGVHHDEKRKGVKGRMVGYVLSEDYWGGGLMSEAVREVVRYMFEEAGYDILSCYHYPFNARSKKVIDKCGFKYEGTLAAASKLYDGSIHDDVCYSITRADYLDIKT